MGKMGWGGGRNPEEIWDMRGQGHLCEWQ